MGIDELRSSAHVPAHQPGQEVDGARPRIALLTPYTGGNLGDAAIQDAMIAHLRHRLPRAQFAGLSLNSDNFMDRHGTEAFPLCGSEQRFYRMYSGKVMRRPGEGDIPRRPSNNKSLDVSVIKQALKGVPVVGWGLKTIYSFGKRVWREFRHSVAGYRFLRRQDLLIVSGGGQLDDEWGGAWGHPFALFKWAVLAWMARVPYAVASVGACKISSHTSRFFLSSALRMARYRSYRDRNSKNIAADLLPRAKGDEIVADLAFSLPSSELPPPAGIRSLSHSRTIVAISPIAYAKPGSWPYEDSAHYDRYLQQMTQIVSQLVQKGYFIVVVSSSLGDDESVTAEMLGRLGEDCRKLHGGQIYVPSITSWKELVASLRDVDFLIASRLHSVILGFSTQKPVIAISFDPKVDWVMEDVEQSDYVLRIRDFTADDVVKALGRVEQRKKIIIEQIADYLQRNLIALTRQYDTLAGLVK